MRYLLFSVLLTFAALVPVDSAKAALVLTVTSPHNLANLTPGQNVSFMVTLSGLAPDDSLDFLAADLQYDPTLLSAPLAITPGVIIPDATGFVPLSFADGASALYDVLPPDPNGPLLPAITDNGVFFSFQVTVLDLGSGDLSFSSVSASGYGQNGPIDSASGGGDLSFNVQPVVVPEPGSLVTLLGGLGLLLGRQVFLHRRSPAKG